MNQFINQPVVSWAKQRLQNNIGVRLRSDTLIGQIIVVLGFTFLALVALFIFGGLLANAIKEVANKGWGDQTAGKFSCLGVMFVIFAAVVSAIGFSLRSFRGKFIKTLTAEGVETRSGKKYDWKNLYFLNYHKIYVAPANVAQTAVFAGAKRIRVDLIFENGKVIVPPLITNQTEVLGLLETMPVQRRDNGLIRQN